MFVIFVTAQVLYQYTAVTMASGGDEYPQPAKAFVNFLGLSSLDFLSFLPASEGRGRRQSDHGSIAASPAGSGGGRARDAAAGRS